MRAPSHSFVPLVVSLLKNTFLFISAESFPPPPSLLDSPGSRKRSVPNPWLLQARSFPNVKLSRNLGTQWSGLWPRISFLPHLCHSLLSFLIKEFMNRLFCGSLARGCSRRAWQEGPLLPRLLGLPSPVCHWGVAQGLPSAL